MGDPELIEEILITNFQNVFQSRPKRLHPIINKNLFRADIKDWKRLRPIVEPLFSTKMLKQMYPKMIKCGNDLINILENCAKNQQNIDLKV